MTQDQIIAEVKKKLTDKLKLVGALVASNAKKNIVDTDAVDSGRLLGSIGFEVEDDTVTIGTNISYASFVELGTVNMTPRPFLRDAVYQHIDEIKKVLSA